MTHLRSSLLVVSCIAIATTSLSSVQQADAFLQPVPSHRPCCVSVATTRSNIPLRSSRFTAPLFITTTPRSSSSMGKDGDNGDNSTDDDDNKLFFPSHYVGLMFDKYVDWCHRKPFRTKSVSAMFILLLGDIIAQAFEAKTLGIPLRINIARTRGFALCGLIFEGPWMHFWYEQVWK